ncbi:sensor histidine kinase [Pedobacter immunditicola]|uniref:sensor histidine kinase n=1 Tax=Pedobacter immunditicola TaxID=3133440 RepID=UPI0030A060EC
MGKFKTSKVIIHLTAWLLFLSFSILFMLQGSRQSVSASFQNPWAFFQFTFLFITIFYLNANYLFTKFYFHKKYLIYGLCCIALLILVLTIKPFDQLIGQFRPPFKPGPERQIFPKPGMHFDLMSMFILITLMGMGTALRSTQEWQLTEKRAIQAEAEHANANLSFLKAQINPHFLYNTLNNIYTLCINSHPEAAESIMKLSHIMRYITDEAATHYVPLQEEIHCINNFIELQRLRLGKKNRLHYKVSGDPSGHLISPLILMTFIENVFKYGISNHHPANIHISLKIEDCKLIFHSTNQQFHKDKPSFNKDKQQTRNGLGISNTKKRLDLLYTGKHQLSIMNKNDLFTVDLILFTKG